MTHDRGLGIAAILGGAGLVAWAVRPYEWGLPGSGGYVAYELANRLFGLLLLGIMAGLYGVHQAQARRESEATRWPIRVTVAGIGLMLVGNVAEFWFLSAWSYSGGEGMARSLAFMTFLFGLAVLISGMIALGLTTLRAGWLPVWISAGLVAAPLLDVGLIAKGTLSGIGLAAITTALGGWLLLGAPLRQPRDTTTGEPSASGLSPSPGPDEEDGGDPRDE